MQRGRTFRSCAQKRQAYRRRSSGHFFRNFVGGGARASERDRPSRSEDGKCAVGRRLQRQTRRLWLWPVLQGRRTAQHLVRQVTHFTPIINAVVHLFSATHLCATAITRASVTLQ